ncbi:hypothetical protein [Bordetella flabilis]|uniref:hypothetical protein n=1 Tax=Bordetella flabilis TaxID=463014 RepID=UPI0012F4795E|nr:hypothetical protein [Bordetella flabilis]
MLHVTLLVPEQEAAQAWPGSIAGSPHAIAVDRTAIPGQGATGQPPGQRGEAGAAKVGCSIFPVTLRFVERAARLFIFWCARKAAATMRPQLFLVTFSGAESLPRARGARRRFSMNPCFRSMKRASFQRQICC